MSQLAVSFVSLLETIFLEKSDIPSKPVFHGASLANGLVVLSAIFSGVFCVQSEIHDNFSPLSGNFGRLAIGM